MGAYEFTYVISSEWATDLCLARRSAISGVYLCCNFATFESDGTFTSKNVTLQLQQMAVFTSTNRDAWVVISVSQDAVYSGSWTKGLSAAAATAREMIVADPLLRGWIVDYEPSTNYTMAHAQAYGAFLGGLARALKPVGVSLGMASGAVSLCTL